MNHICYPLQQTILHLHYNGAVVLAVYLVEDLSYLRLRQTLRIQAPGELLALFLLVPQYGQDLRMEVPETVPGDPELQLPSMAVGMAQPVSVTLVPVLLFP